MDGKKFVVRPEICIEITQEDIDDIMCCALEGGITYWCFRAEVVGEYRGEYASEQISRGGMLKLYDSENGEKYWLTLDGFLDGVKLWFEQGLDASGCVHDGKIDTCDIDAEAADQIVQLALFKEVIYG